MFFVDHFFIDVDDDILDAMFVDYQCNIGFEMSADLRKMREIKSRSDSAVSFDAGIDEGAS